MLENMYDDVAERYDEKYSAEEYKQEDRDLFAELGKFCVGRVLDIGCGTGIYLDYTDTDPKNYVGIDPSHNMLEVARRKHPEFEFVETTFEDYTEDEKFDTIVSLYSSASYISPEHYRRFTSQLNEGGKFYVMVHKPDYSPDYYTPEMIKAVHDNINYERLASLPRTKLYEFAKYIVATNAEVSHNGSKVLS